jgi:hypothetical protein
MSTTSCIHRYLHFSYYFFLWLTLTLPVHSSTPYPLWRILDKWLSRRHKYLSQKAHYVPSEKLHLTKFKKGRFLLKPVQWRSDPNRIMRSVVPISRTWFCLQLCLMAFVRKKIIFLVPISSRPIFHCIKTVNENTRKCSAYFNNRPHHRSKQRPSWRLHF